MVFSNKRFSKLSAISAAVLILAIIASTVCSALTLSYNVGNEYKNSYYHTAVTDIELTGDQRYDIISIALSQLGYHTGDSEAEMDGKNVGGIKGFAEYNRIYGKVDNGQGNGVSYGYYWCACFVSWCLRQAGIPTSTVPSKCASRKILSALQDNGMYAKASSGYKPLCGDIIFFRDADSSHVTHIGFVVGVKESTVYTVEGNGNDHVTARSYSMNDPYIEGYGKVKYKTVEGMSYNFALTTTEELYFPFTHSEAVNVYAEPGSDNKVIFTIPPETVFDIYQVKGCWAKVNTPEGYGWCDTTDCTQVIPTPAFAVKYYLCGGVGGNLDQISYEGEQITLCKTAPVRTGYTFKGWAESPDGEVKYQPGDTYSGKNGDSLKELFAIWQADTYNLKYTDENGNTVAEYTVEHGDKIPSAKAPEKPSDDTYRYKFTGWSPAVAPVALGDAVFTPAYKAEKLVPDTTVPETTKAPETDPPVTTAPPEDTETLPVTDTFTDTVTETVTEDITENTETTGDDTISEEITETNSPTQTSVVAEDTADISAVTTNTDTVLHNDALKQSPTPIVIAIAVVGLAAVITAGVIFAVKSKNR